MSNFKETGMTNIEYIRTLSILGMAEILYTTKHRCGYCKYLRHAELIHDCPYRKAVIKSPKICKQAISEWLVEEIEK